MADHDYDYEGMQDVIDIIGRDGVVYEQEHGQLDPSDLGIDNHHSPGLYEERGRGEDGVLEREDGDPMEIDF